MLNSGSGNISLQIKFSPLQVENGCSAVQERRLEGASKGNEV